MSPVGSTARDRFVIEGGHPVGGTVTPSGNKNEALPLLAASLLALGSVVIENVPRIRNVETLIELLRGLGVQVDWSGDHVVGVDASTLRDSRPDVALASEIRGSFLLVAPLLARSGLAVLPRPGGDKIGRRRLDTHLLALRQLGARIELEDAYDHLKLDGCFRGAEVFLDEASVTATETAVMAAAAAEGRTRILNAASEPHVQGLCDALNAMGARITGIGGHVLEIDGVARLHPARHRVAPDHIEIGSLVAVAAMTGGELRVQGVVPDHLRMVRIVFARLAWRRSSRARRSGCPRHRRARSSPTSIARSPRSTMLRGRASRPISPPWPSCSRHNRKGRCSSTRSSSRAVCSSSTACRLHGATIVSPDIRAGMALIAAALCAQGRSVIHNVRQVDRGYERIDDRLRGLGARILRE